MNSKLQEIEICSEEPFKNCKLGRRIYADILTQLVSTYTNGYVLSINGEWGTGKTTFIKMWEKHLNNQKFKTLYFNVWEHDFITDPLVGFIGQLRKLDTTEATKAKMADVVTAFGKITMNMFPKIVKGFLKQQCGDEIAEVLEKGAEAYNNQLCKELDNYQEQCNSIKEFRNSIANFIDLCNDGKPLIFIVDELDRCNPTYAVKVLERIKHLFNVPNIVFVLSIDKVQLCNSIKGYYGSDLINAEEYLKRFIDIEYNLPEPDTESFAEYLYNFYEFDTYFKHRQTNESPSFYFKKMSNILFMHKHLSLRQMERIYAHARIVLQTIPKGYKLLPEIIILLIYFRLFEVEMYNNIKHKNYQSIDELVTDLEEKLPNKLFVKGYESQDKEFRFMIGTIAQFLACYSINRNGYRLFKLVEINPTPKLLYETHKLDKDILLEFQTHYENNYISNSVLDLNVQIEHIELLSMIHPI